MTTEPSKRLVLIDGKSVFYRGYYAMGALALPDGTPTGGVYGFAAISMEIVKELKPTKVVVAWDSKTSAARRREIYPEYKAGRVKPGPDFYAQIPLLEQLVKELGWGFVSIEEFEADDIIGTLSKQADEVLDKNGVCEYETYILSSDLDMLQVVDENTHMWRILKGFSEIQQLDVAEVEAKYGIKQAQFLDFKALKGDSSDNIPGVPGIGDKTAAKLLNEYGSLDGVYENLASIAAATQKKLAAGKESAYMSKELAQIRFDAPVKLAELPEFHFDREKTVAALKKLAFNSLIRKFGQEGWGTATDSQVAGKSDDEVAQMEDQVVIESPDNLLVGWDVKKIMHDKAEVAQEILAGRPFWDLAQGAFLLNPLRQEEPILGDLQEIYEEQRQAYQKFPRLYGVLTQFDLPLIPILYQMEKHGMLIDLAYFEQLRKEYAKRLEKRQEGIWEMAGQSFNLNSPMQLSEVLFGKLGLPTKGIKKTRKGYSTGAKELEKLRPLHPIIEQIFEYREVSKLLSTYITPMPGLADKDERVHTTFTQNVTATGRLSSVNPNLQNIPVRTEEGKRIREGFVAPEGRVLISADYAQFELRLAAVLAGDKELIADFNSGVDIHTKTAAEAFHVPVDKVTKEQRRAAKVINFGILYGMSVPGLAAAAGMTIHEAKQFIDNYFALRAPIKRKLEEYLTQAREQGYVETFFGRRRPTPDVKSTNYLVRQAAERAAENMPIQGTEADLMKRAMIEVSGALPKGAELVMQVHDSLIVECDLAVADEVEKILQEKMEKVAPELKIRLEVEVTRGKNWGEL